MYDYCSRLDVHVTLQLLTLAVERKGLKIIDRYSKTRKTRVKYN